MSYLDRFLKNTNAPGREAYKTDETPSGEVLSVSSAPSQRASQTRGEPPPPPAVAYLLHPERTPGTTRQNRQNPPERGFVGFVGASPEHISESAVPWDQPEAEQLVTSVLASWGWHDDPNVRGRLNELGDAIDRASLSRDLAGLRRAVEAFRAFVRPLPPPWDQAEADRLLSELHTLVDQLRRSLFRGTVPEPLATVVSDYLAVAEAYASDHEREAGRGWDALELLRDVQPRLRQIIERAKAEKKPAGWGLPNRPAGNGASVTEQLCNASTGDSHDEEPPRGSRDDDPGAAADGLRPDPGHGRPAAAGPARPRDR